MKLFLMLSGYFQFLAIKQKFDSMPVHKLLLMYNAVFLDLN